VTRPPMQDHEDRVVDPRPSQERSRTRRRPPGREADSEWSGRIARGQEDPL
jgi:hypothetical protein